MTIPFPSLSDASPLRAVLARELRAAFVNRYLQVFAVLALAGGVAAVAFTDAPTAAGFVILQINLYFASLFALLVGVSSARAESEEWPMLFTQPVPRAAFVIGKFLALWLIFGAVLAILFVPALWASGAWQRFAVLYVQTLGLAAVFGSLGLCAGFIARDRVQGLIAAVAVWLLLLFGLDLAALFGAQWPFFQKLPDLWVSVLMLNPLDAFRIEALFAMEQIPAEAADKTPLAHWWLTHTGAWFSLLAFLWTAALIFVTSRRLNRWEE